MKCINKAWDLYETELRQFLLGKVSHPAIAEDLLQDVFVKALRHRSEFCQLENTRAWLFRVTRNSLIDFYRTHKDYSEIDDQYPIENSEVEPVINLNKCLPVALKRLKPIDQDIIEQCDLEGMRQADYAVKNGLGLPATKARLQRARKRLKTELHSACQIILDEQGNVCCFDPKCQ